MKKEMEKGETAQSGKEHICLSCGKPYDSWEVLTRDFGGEIGVVTFCPHCKEEVN